jgi:tetratricopeptide (TPR) repeat protein
MTVRWKPLLILSGLFFVVAVIGVIAMVWALVPRSTQGVLKQARTATAEGRYENAEIYYKQALQIDPRSAAIHEEFADLYREWSRGAPAEKREALLTERIAHLRSAVKYDKSGRGPRIQLLEIALGQDTAADSVYWAREVLKVDAEYANAHYALAFEELETPSPTIPEVRRHLKVLKERNAPPIRQALIEASLAQATGDDRARDEVFSRARSIVLPQGADTVDQLARVRLEAIEIQTEIAPQKLADEVKSLLGHVRELVAAPDLTAGRVTRLSQLLERTQRALVLRLSPAAKTGGANLTDPLASAIEVELAEMFQKVLSGNQKPELQVYMTYADHLRFRQQRDRCIQVVEEALRLPAAALPASIIPVMGMHAVAAEMALSRQDDPERYRKAEPHVAALLGSSEPRFQGLGHLFRGAIELEQSGLVHAVSREGEKTAPAQAPQPKLRKTGLNHLKQAAAQLPSVAEAQARYGVALVLNQEQNLGRQYLQSALRQGNLEPQYQFWAAWTILQAGYPEEAEPILDSLFRQLAQGRIPAELEGTLHQISGELYQVRRAPGDLERAAQEFAKAASVGRGGDPVVALRQAQIEVQLGHHDLALARIDKLRKEGRGGPGAENLAVLIYEEQGKKEEARRLLRDARARFPKAAELAGLEAAMMTRDGQPAVADRILQKFLADDPDNVSLSLMRAQNLADSLKKPKEASDLLLALSERSDNSAPLVQLAQIEMEQNDLESAAATIAKIRTRWTEAATGDILEGQLALKRGSIVSAREHFSEALRKDPDNKIVQFWKAQLDSRAGSVSEATRVLEDLVKNRPSKEVDAGVTLLSAAQSALANIELQTGKLDDAIRRFEELRRSSQSGTLSRTDRWQLITAYVAKDQWPLAKRELAAILNDTKNPPTADDRVRGANFYRQHKEDAVALGQLDYVLKVNPTHAAGVVTRSYIHMSAKEYDQAGGMLRKAISLVEKKQEKPPAVFYLMLAAVLNEAPPAATAAARAKAALEEGLLAQPQSIELVNAEYLLLSSSGDAQGGLAAIEAHAKNDSKGIFRRLLVDVLREQRQYERAEQELRRLTREAPDDVNLSAALVQVVSLEAAEAAALGKTDRQRALDDQALSMIRDYRKRYPQSLAFLQAECDLAARGGDVNRAVAITEEIDKVSPSSPLGPILRARLFSRQDKTAEVVKAYGEALERNPNQPDIRILLGQELIKMRDGEGALKQARIVLETKKERLDAILLEARALAATGSTDDQKEAAREAAAARLEAAITAEPRYREAYYALAEIEQARGRRSAAVSVLKRGLKANPDDSMAVAKLIQTLAGPGPGGQPAGPEDIEQAQAVAAEIAPRDKDGSLVLAAGVGFHKSGQLERALPLSEQAATKLDNAVAHLNLGDLLLSMAESQPDQERARPLFERAVGEYDRVLKIQPTQIEAVNNKAWVLHSYLRRSPEALELAQGLMRRVSPAALPGEFYDTLGAIQESLGRTTEAEQSYQSGLAKTPDHPVLNYHFGKMLAADRKRADRARTYLAKALAGRELLGPVMARDAEGLVKQLSRSISGN